MNLVFDLLLAAAMVLLADTTLRQRNSSAAVVQFMVFGLVTSIGWVRVQAPDLALTEAAIGSGITGALLLAALKRIGLDAPPSGYVAPWIRVCADLGCLVLGGCMTWILLTHWPASEGLTAAAYQALPESGASNPVTAVVLNYRAWDTLLEMVVLWAAAVAATVIRDVLPVPRPADPDPIYRFYLGRIAPFIFITIAYIIWVGARAPGGAFPAGALLGGLGVLILLGPHPPRLFMRSVTLRGLLVVGTAVFLIVGTGMLASGRMLEYPAGQAKVWILLVEVGCTLSIGLSFIVLFAACSGSIVQERPS